MFNKRSNSHSSRSKSANGGRANNKSFELKMNTLAAQQNQKQSLKNTKLYESLNLMGKSEQSRYIKMSLNFSNFIRN